MALVAFAEAGFRGNSQRSFLGPIPTTSHQNSLDGIYIRYNCIFDCTNGITSNIIFIQRNEPPFGLGCLKVIRIKKLT